MSLRSTGDRASRRRSGSAIPIHRKGTAFLAELVESQMRILKIIGRKASRMAVGLVPYMLHTPVGFRVRSTVLDSPSIHMQVRGEPYTPHLLLAPLTFVKKSVLTTAKFEFACAGRGESEQLRDGMLRSESKSRRHHASQSVHE